MARDEPQRIVSEVSLEESVFVSFPVGYSFDLPKQGFLEGTSFSIQPSQDGPFFLMSQECQDTDHSLVSIVS
jgi:hypothetical protein